jgi:hypothetical protein
MKDVKHLGMALSDHYCDDNRHSCSSKLIDEIYSLHDGISNWFCNQAWKDLTHRDSNIMLNILEILVRNEVPALPIHDSVIVPKSRAKEAQHVMQQVYMNHMDNFITAEIQDD